MGCHVSGDPLVLWRVCVCDEYSASRCFACRFTIIISEHLDYKKMACGWRVRQKKVRSQDFDKGG